MSFQALAAAAALLSGLPASALADVGVDVEILDRRTGAVLPVYWHDGERHVAGEPGCEYEIRLRNRGGGRVLAVTSVDGVNVITGRNASTAQSGYVLDPWGLVAIDGWRKSMDQVAAFYFTALPDSYAARTGRPDNVGVIGVALFHERAAVMPLEAGSLSREAPAAPAAQGSVERKAAGADREMDDRLGTGHGRSERSRVSYTHFERATASPVEMMPTHYDTHANLSAVGVIRAPRLATPFPGQFVPDPR